MAEISRSTSVELVSGAEMKFLTNEALQFYWGNIEELLDRVPHTWNENFTKESILQRLLSNSMQAWVVGDSQKIRVVIFTQVAVHPIGNTLEVFWAAGTGFLEQAADTVDSTLEYFARTQNCVRIDVIGRMGWEPKLLKRGFKRMAVVMSRPILPQVRSH